MPAPEPGPGPVAVPGDALAELLDGTYVDPDTGDTLDAPVRALVIEDSLRDREVELLTALDLGPRLAVVGDDDTFAALGARVARALASRFEVQRLSLGRRPHADRDTADRLIAELSPRTDAIVAVGSGTINDLCKLAAQAKGCPQVVFATAPSMNGYTSVSASILDGGHKRSVRAETPIGVFFDLEVLAGAPPRLLRAGLGDSLCRPTAQADWLLAHLLLEQPYREAPFSLLAADEEVLLADPGALLRGDLAALRSLARTLALSGFGMTLCGGSYPASQGEHLLAHYLEMRGATRDAFHGEQIGVTTLAMARLQEAVLERDEPPPLAPCQITAAALAAHFGAELGASCWHELRGKCFDAARARQLDRRLRASWPSWRARLRAVSRPARQLTAALRAAGAPTTPAELGWSDRAFADALVHARAIRNRYTFLDLVADAGLSAPTLAAER